MLSLSFRCSSEAKQKKQFASYLFFLERGLRCNTCSTEGVLLPEEEEAALEGWCRPCARCGGTHPAQSAWRPLAVHCPSSLEEKHVFVTVLHLFVPLKVNPHVERMCALDVIWCELSVFARRCREWNLHQNDEANRASSVYLKRTKWEAWIQKSFKNKWN